MAETSNALALDDGAFEQLVSERVSARFREQLAEHSEELLLWLALAPAWPRRYVEAGFPTRRGMATGISAVAAVDHAVASGLAQSGRNDADPVTPIYWMTQVQADSILAFVRKQTSGTSRILEALAGAAHALRRASTTSPPSEDLERWCRLGEAGPSEQAMADLLDREMESSLREAESRRATSCPEARRWIETATPIADVLSGPLRVALLRARRRFELFHRRATDRRFLVNFLERESQIVPFRELLGGPDDRWALHYVGGGGAGKTMLIRHLTADLAPPLGLAVARVDFDHLNPEYPTRAPALLLAAFAEELRLHEKETPSGFDYFYSAVNTLHEDIEARGGTSGGEAALLAAEPAVRAFVDALRKLQMRPLLILDTCEELAKLQPDGRMPDNVRVTFDILERIHRDLPSLRVVFSGRRPLAGKGSGWECPASLLVPRDYLRLHVLSGFNRDEATAFLGAFRERDRVVPPGTFATILERSITSDLTFGKRFTWTGGEDEQRASERYNPYDLSMYASLAAGDRLNPGAGKHAYVRERIIERLPRLLGPLTPALVKLGTFDRGLIEALCGGASVNAETLAEEVSQQHWIGRVASAGGASDEPRWKVDDIDRRRLREYYEEECGSLLSGAERQLEAILPPVTLDRPWKDLDIAYFDAALQVLQHDRGRTLSWWMRVEDRIAADAEWDWAKRMTASLLASEEGSWEGAAAKVPDPLIRASLLATHAAASARMQRSADQGLWAAVLTTLKFTDDEGVDELRRRTFAGILNAMQWSNESSEIFAVLLMRFMALGPPELFNSDTQLATEVAFCEGAVEILERAAVDPWRNAERAAADPWRNLELTVGEVEETDVIDLLRERWPYGRFEDRAPLLCAYLSSLHARLEVLRGGVTEADRLFQSSLRGIESAAPLEQFLDWTPPADPVARLRLEAVRGLALRFDVRRLEMPRLTTPWSLDSDRLASAIWIARSSTLLIDDIPPPRRPQRNIAEPALCNAHRLIPSYLATDIEQQAARGEVGPALKRCRAAIRDAERSSDVLMQDGLARLQGRLICRYRLFDQDERPSPIVFESEQFEDQELVIRYTALSGTSYHAPGNDRKTVYFESRRRGLGSGPVLEFISRPSSPVPATWATFADLWLDLYGGLATLRRSESPLRQRALDWACATASDPIDGIRIATMIFSLDGPEDVSNVLTSLGERAGFRRAAEVIVEECELGAIADRLESAAPLTLAAEWFRGANDNFGAFRANVVAAMAWNSPMTASGILESLPAELPFPTAEEIRLTVSSERPIRSLLEKIDSIDAELRPWVVRGIAACIGFAPKTPALGRVRDRFVTWLEERYQGDLARLLHPERSKPEKLTAPIAQMRGELFALLLFVFGCSILINLLWWVPRPLDSLGSALGWSAAAIAILVLIVNGKEKVNNALTAALAGVWVGFYYAITKIPGSAVFGPPGSFSSAFSVSAIIGLLGYFGYFASQTRLAELRDSLRIRMARRLHFDVATETMTLESGLGSLTTDIVLHGEPPVDTRYVVLQKELANETTAALEHWLSYARRKPLPIKITLSGNAQASLCWEAMVAPTLFGEEPFPLLAHRRFVGRPDKPSNFHRLDTVLVITVGASMPGPWAPVIANDSLAYLSVDAMGPGTHDIFCVSHLVGLPSEVRGGIRLELSDEGGSRNTLVEPFEVAIQSARFCIIQGRPNDVMVRTDTDRLVAAQLRRFGAEVFFSSSKVPIVMVIPPLPTATANAVIHEIALGLANRRLRTVEDFERLTGRMRQMIIDSAPRSGPAGLRTRFWEAAVERAYDVCVYLDFVPDLRPQLRNENISVQ